jgi:thiaminase/transcriptional activator TenA
VFVAAGRRLRVTQGRRVVFLDAFCRAYALALAKSPDQDGLIAFRELLDAAAEELRLHRGYAERWNVDLHQAADPATAAYTNFLLAVAALEPVGHIAAAMIPCLRLYAYLGQQLAAQTTPDSPYREWVMTYSSARFEAGVLSHVVGERRSGQLSRRDALDERVLQRGFRQDPVPVP